MKKRIKAAKKELGFHRSSFYLGLIFGVIIGVLLASLFSILLSSIGIFDVSNNKSGNVSINADIVVNKISGENRIIVQLTNETDADSIYVVTTSDNPKNRSSKYYLGEKGDAKVGSTVIISIGSESGDVFARKGDEVRIVGVKNGETKVLRRFTITS